jgi:hypothetical protein
VTNIHAFGDTYRAYNFQADGFPNKRNFILSFYSENYYTLQVELLDLTTGRRIKEKYGQMLRGNAYSCTVEGMEGNTLQLKLCYSPQTPYNII